eukprot:1733878-Pyramimonas_sp.AAC.1
MQMDEHIPQKDRIRKMMDINTAGAYEIPLDHWTDCEDVFELVAGLKGVPQDKLQRLPIMALREERITTRIRRTLHVPTEIMVADAMTKPGVFRQMMELLTTGYLDMEMVQKNATARRILHRPDTYSESDLESIIKFDWVDQIHQPLESRTRLRISAYVSFTCKVAADRDRQQWTATVRAQGFAQSELNISVW